MVAEIAALVIFVIMFLLIVLDRIPRQWVTLGCGALMLVLVFGICMHDGGAIWDTLNLSAFGQSTFWYGTSESSGGINWSTIVFIAGMMVMVEGMGHVGVFRWLCLKLGKAVHYRTVPLLVCFMVMAAVLSMFIDSITVILFLAAVTAELGRTLRFDPVPMILAEIFCANLGGSATMCGDPPNIIIGTSLGLTFFDFLTNTGVIVLICLVATVVYFYFCFRRILRESESQRPTDITYPDAASAITDRRAFIACGAVFLLVVVLLVTHAQTELTVATIGCIAAVLMALATLCTSGGHAAAGLFAKVDYHTLLFFIGLFVVVSGLEDTGCLDVLAGWISRISGGHAAVMVAIILWLSAVCSAFVDNIPFSATMVPVIQSMSQSQGVDLSLLAWALSIGTDLGGSATPIGASANVVGTSVAATLAAVQNAKTVIGVINPNVPRAWGDAIIRLSDIDIFCEDNTPLIEAHPSVLTEQDIAIGKNVATLIEDGATLQMGIGAIPNAVLSQLGNHKNLGIHTEMFADGVLPLYEKGVVNNMNKKFDKGKIVSTFLMGSKRVYDFIDDNPGVAMMDVGYRK